MFVCDGVRKRRRYGGYSSIYLVAHYEAFARVQVWWSDVVRCNDDSNDLSSSELRQRSTQSILVRLTLRCR